MNTPKSFACLLAVFSFTAALQAATALYGKEVALAGPVERYVVIDNVCAWPNLTVLRDGTIAATIYNSPNHGTSEGAVDVWASQDGRFWEKRGVAAPNEPKTIRMNVAAGLAGNGDLIVLSSGWSDIQQPNQPKKRPFRDAKLPVAVCRSSDGGRTWTRTLNFPPPTPGWGEFVPFGDIHAGADGALHAACYESKREEEPLPVRVWHFRSDDDGRTWRATSVIGASQIAKASNETSILYLGGKNWLAAVREEGPKLIELFRSEDDGQTWVGPQRVTRRGEVNAHLARLKDGRLLLSYGNRIEGEFGVMAKFSSDEGRTWSAPIRLADSLVLDCGYPSSVQRPDGSIVTAYYSLKTQTHTRYHMAVVIWTPPAP